MTSTRSDMAATLRAEGLITLDQACRLFPADNAKGHVSPGSLVRWILDGKRRTKLEALRERGQWYTSLAALTRFRAAAGG